MEMVVSNNPFAGRDFEPGKLAVTFLSTALGSETKDMLSRIAGIAEEIHARERELYIYFPDGMGRSKLAPILSKMLENTGTARNWNTVTKLLAMAREADEVTTIT
jgi:uncharacterized protein (DUF1697 family)